MDKKSLVRKGAGQELCIQHLVCHQLPGCLSRMPLPLDLSWLLACGTMVYIPELPSSSEFGITSMQKPTGYCADTIVRAQSLPSTQ